ncbi:MAG: efflux transporter outer membrane subunit [Planctomycetota bacterium]
MSRPVRFVFALAGVSGCAIVGEDYVAPVVETDASWAASAEPTVEDTQPVEIGRWWLAFEDDDLDALVHDSLRGNLDLAAAVERVRQSAAIRARSAGQRFPDVDATGSYSRTRTSGTTFPPFPSQTFDLYSLGLDFDWEIDVWGRVTRSIEAADADYQASVEDLRDVEAVLVASVASAYVDLRTGQERLDVALQNIEIQRRSLDLTETRFRAGAAPALDVAQARTNLANTESELPTIQADVRDATLRLGVLVGRSPAELIDAFDAGVEIPTAPILVGAGVPADVLRRRPDVRAAERRLAAEVARIGVESGDLFPRFTLIGSLGYESTESGQVFDAGSQTFGFGPAFSWNLFDGGRERSDIEAQRAAADAALLDYRQSVLLAFEEAEQSLYRLARERERVDALKRAADAARDSADLSRQLYLEGRSDFQNVLDAERSLFAAQESLILGRSAVAQTYVSLHRALGGGWEPPPESPDDPERADP